MRNCFISSETISTRLYDNCETTDSGLGRSTAIVPSSGGAHNKNLPKAGKEDKMESVQGISRSMTSAEVRKMGKEVGVLHCRPKCPTLSAHVVERASRSPTITVRAVIGEGKLSEFMSVTPYHMMGRLGIGAFNHMNAPTKHGDIDAHYSVHSYLWAMEYYGLMAYIAKWPAGHSFPTQSLVREPYGYRWGGSAYRPEYAFLAILSFMGWDSDEVQNITGRMLALPRGARLSALQKTAAHYLQNPVDAYAPNGFHRLTDTGGCYQWMDLYV